MSTLCLVCDHQHLGHRYACDDCVIRLQRKLREIDIYWDILACEAMHEPSRGTTGRMSPGYSSRSPARDDVLVALDIRSSGMVFGADDVDQPTVSITAGVDHLAAWVRDHTDQPCSGLYGLLTAVPYAAQCRDVHEFAGWITRLHNQLRVLAHDQPPRPLGRCLKVDRDGDCGGDVYPTWRGEEDGARCSRCGRVYTGLDLVRLSVAQEAS